MPPALPLPAGEVVLHALDDFSATVSTQMADELLRISEAELEYHTGAPWRKAWLRAEGSVS